MTLDGHIKVGLATIPLAMLVSPYYIDGLSPWALFVLSVSAFLGNLFPDFSEMNIIPHRTFTHYWPVYLGSGWFFFQVLAANPETFWALGGLGISAGALMHILCDWPYYGGCPLINPKRKLPLFGLTFDGGLNRPVEYAVILVCLLVAGFMVMPEIESATVSRALFEG